jgi:hypothetical protein
MIKGRNESRDVVIRDVMTSHPNLLGLCARQQNATANLPSLSALQQSATANLPGLSALQQSVTANLLGLRATPTDDD